MSNTPKLIVVAPSAASRLLAAHILGQAASAGAAHALTEWWETHESAPATTEARGALVALSWPAVLIAETVPTAGLLEVLAEVWLQTRFLFLAEAPARALAAELPLAEGHSIAAWSAQWAAATRRVVRHLQRFPDRSLCLAAQECADEPRALRPLLNDRLGLQLASETLPGEYARPTELNLALANMLLAPEASLATSAAELFLSCPPLGEPSAESALALDGGAVLNELAALSRQAARAPELQQRVATLEPDLGAAKEEANLFRMQLREAQEDLQRHRAELARQKAMVKDALEAEIEASRRENDLLLVQLHEAQEELERYCLENRELVQRAKSGPAALEVQFDTCEVLDRREKPPHMELTLQLRGVRLGDAKPIDQVYLRLVEHHGRPGIVFVRQAEGERPYLTSWQETGRADDQPYMLIIPGDDPGRAQLQRLPTTDWDALVALMHRLSATLYEQPAIETRLWPGIAARLARQIDESAPRLRYDRLQVEPAQPEGYIVSFGAAMFGARRFEQLRLLWRPESPGPLTLLTAEDAKALPSLDEWPKADGGAWLPELPLPLSSLSARERRVRWARMSPSDRGLLVALLDALPASVAVAGSTGLITEEQAARLRKAAAGHIREGLVASGQYPGLVRRLIRRLRQLAR